DDRARVLLQVLDEPRFHPSQVSQLLPRQPELLAPLSDPPAQVAGVVASGQWVCHGSSRASARRRARAHPAAPEVATAQLVNAQRQPAPSDARSERPDRQLPQSLTAGIAALTDVLQQAQHHHAPAGRRVRVVIVDLETDRGPRAVCKLDASLGAEHQSVFAGCVVHRKYQGPATDDDGQAAKAVGPKTRPALTRRKRDDRFGGSTLARSADAGRVVVRVRPGVWAVGHGQVIASARSGCGGRVDGPGTVVLTGTSESLG